MTVDAPLATYSERLLEVRRDFALFPDRVVVRARWLRKGTFESVVQLDSLSPQPREFLVRYRVHRHASWVMALSLLAFAMIVYSAKGAPLGPFAYLVLAISVPASAVTLLTFRHRRIRFARFEARSGKGGLDVGQAGSDPATFQAFVAATRQQIQRR